MSGSYPLGREEPLAAGVPDDNGIFDILTTALSRAPRALTPVGTLTVSMSSGPISLDPGAVRTVAFTAEWDADLDPSARYRAFIPVYAAEIEIVIITATKPEPGGQTATATGKKKRK